MRIGIDLYHFSSRVLFCQICQFKYLFVHGKKSFIKNIYFTLTLPLGISLYFTYVVITLDACRCKPWRQIDPWRLFNSMTVVDVQFPVKLFEPHHGARLPSVCKSPSTGRARRRIAMGDIWTWVARSQVALQTYRAFSIVLDTVGMLRLVCKCVCT